MLLWPLSMVAAAVLHGGEKKQMEEGCVVVEKEPEVDRLRRGR